MNEAQRAALVALCDRYRVPFVESDFHPTFDLPDGYVAGWVGYEERIADGFFPRGMRRGQAYCFGKVYVGVAPDGTISS